MKSEIVKNGKTKKYEYITLLIADKKLIDFSLVTEWNHGVLCKKEGSAISITLRRTL